MRSRSRSRSASKRGSRPTTTRRGSRPVLGAAVGFGGIALLNAGFAIFDPEVTRAVPLLLLFVPVTISGVLGGWKASVPLAVVTGLAYSFHFVAPTGTIRLGVTEDTVSTMTFVGVAIFISELGRRADARRSERERQRSVLLRSVSHDLRNPLGAIRAASADLRADVIGDSATRNQLLDLVLAESDRLDRIVRNLLSLSRVEAGALAPDQAPESLAEIAHASAQRLERGAGGGAHHAQITVDVPDDLPDVLVDRVQLDQVITNLIENALRHAVGSSTIDVSARMVVPGSVTVSVTDSGPGFKAAAGGQTFEFFKPSGITGAEGIGLAVCKAIVEAHGGSITADDAPDGGARVTFSIPTAE